MRSLARPFPFLSPPSHLLSPPSHLRQGTPSRTESSLHHPTTHSNRDTWASDGVSAFIASAFVLLQLDSRTAEAAKVSTFYSLAGGELPVILLIDPITGARLHSWAGFVEAEKLLEDLLTFADRPPSQALSAPNRKRKAAVGPAAGAGPGAGAGAGGAAGAGGEGGLGAETDAELVRPPGQASLCISLRSRVSWGCAFLVDDALRGACGGRSRGASAPRGQ